MKKYIYVLALLALLTGLAAGHTYFGWGEQLFAGQDGRALPAAALQTADREVMPPVHAPEQTIRLTFPSNFIDLAGLARSALTGQWICEEAAARRPFAVVLGNSEVSLPQSGVSQAEIVAEVISEGVTTRLIGIFQDFDSAKIGSVRSARHYFVDIALDYDAFFVHFGGSPQTFQAIRDLRINNINGIQHDGGVRTENFANVVFWRDAERWRVSRMREHSAYTSAENLLRQAGNAGFRMEKSNPSSGPFDFYDSPNNHPYAEPAPLVMVRYAGNNPVVFEFNAETGRYYRYYRSERPQIDEETGLQLAVENVIVQLTSVTSIQGDAEGRRNVAVVGSGNGYLFTNGTVIPLRWSKPDSNTPTEWTFEDGTRLTLNRGRTWICITNREPELE